MQRIITIFFILNSAVLFAQSPCDDFCINFEDTLCSDLLVIDTSISNNVWQTGQPHKILFDSAFSFPNAIITDTLNPYPANNYSVFTIQNLATMGDVYGMRMFHGMYQVETDSLKDYGSIEFSADNGLTWIDVINDTIYNTFVWFSSKPVLTGNSKRWKYFDVLFTDIGSVFGVKLGDTLLFRFSFTTDGVHENLDGLMYDDLCFQYFVEGIHKIRFSPIKSKIFPNPSSDFISIEFENPKSEIFEISIYTIHSK